MSVRMYLSLPLSPNGPTVFHSRQSRPCPYPSALVYVRPLCLPYFRLVSSRLISSRYRTSYAALELQSVYKYLYGLLHSGLSVQVSLLLYTNINIAELSSSTLCVEAELLFPFGKKLSLHLKCMFRNSVALDSTKRNRRIRTKYKAESKSYS